MSSSMPSERKAIIFEGVKQAAFVHGLEMIPDEGLLDEVAGLAEWPVVLIGTIEDQFMDVPPEILQTSMRTHQKYFSLRDPKTGKMANRFALVANMVAERRRQARSSPATNACCARGCRTPSSSGTRTANARWKAASTTSKASSSTPSSARSTSGSSASKRWPARSPRRSARMSKKAKRAARLCKADLTTGVVGEFPELQGVMGRYYALHRRRRRRSRRCHPRSLQAARAERRSAGG